MIGVDTNLLIYAHRAGTPEHRAAQAALERAAENRSGWGIPLPVIAEFYAVVTHPSAAGGPSSPAQARAFLEALVLGGRAQIWSPAEEFWSRLVAVAAEKQVYGVRIFDLQIGLIAEENGATEIWSHDRQFVAPEGMKLLDPL
jgi:uncharacterized protein